MNKGICIRQNQCFPLKFYKRKEIIETTLLSFLIDGF